jgi:MFS family permease
MWYHGWTIVGMLVVSQVAGNSLTYNAFSLFLKVWSHDLHVPVSQLVVAVTALVLVAAPLSPMVGVLADRYPARWLFGVGLVIMGGFCIGISLVTQAWQIIALYAFVAAPALVLSTAVPGNALISRWFVRRLGLALGISAFGIGLGGVVMPPLVAALLPLVGWRMIWRAGGVIIAVVVMPLVLLVLRDRPEARDGGHYLTPDGQPERVLGHGAVAGAAASSISWGEILGRRNFWMLVVTFMLILGSGSAFIQNMGPLAASRGLGAREAGMMLAAVGVAHVVATLALGLAADRFGNRVPMAGLALLVGGGMAALAFGHSLPVLVLGAGLIGANAGVMTPLAAGIATEFGPGGFGKAFGVAMLCLPITTPMGIVVAKVQEHTGSYIPALMVAIAAQALAVVLALLLRERGRKGGAEALAF